MARAKKDGRFVNFYLDRELCEKLTAYAEDKGQTVTTALERILKMYFEKYAVNQDTVDKKK